MDQMVISSKLLKRAIENLIRRIVRKKLEGMNVKVRFPEDIQIVTENNGEILHTRFSVDIEAFTNDIFKLFVKED